MRTFLIVAACAVTLCGCTDMRSAFGEAETLPLEQAPWADAYCQWTPRKPEDHSGLPRINTSVAGGRLRINSLPFERGLGVGGNAAILYTIGGRAASFKVLVGIDDASTLASGGTVVEIRGDGQQLACDTIAAHGAPVMLDIVTAGIQDLLIRVAAPTGVFTDILLPDLVGVAGLRSACEEGRQRVAESFVTQPVAGPAQPVALAGGAWLFACDYPGQGSCLGMSNGHVCVVVSPLGGRVVHLGRTLDDNMLGADGSAIAPHPDNRRVAPLRAAYHDAWKWKAEDTGTLRLLSPADAPHGIRWSRTFRLEPAAPVVHVAVMTKNISGHTVSWSAGTEFAFAPDAQATLPSDCKAAGTILVRKGGSTLRIEAAGARHGLYPHNGLRVRKEGSRYVLFDELTPLSPGEDSVRQQQWSLERGGV